MRYPSKSRSSQRSPNSWAYIFGIIWALILLVIFFIKSFSGENSSEVGKKSLTLTSSGKIVITDVNGEKRDAKNNDSLKQDDTLLSVISWNTHMNGEWLKAWADKWAEVSYKEEWSSGISLNILQWRGWIESKNDIIVKLKHIEILMPKDSIVLVEQQRIYSIAYVLKGTPTIRTNGWREIPLIAWRWIKISQSDLVNQWTDLLSLTDEIDDSIKQNPFFLSRNWTAILSAIKTESSTWALVNTGIISQWSGAIAVNLWWKFISIISPSDGSVITWDTLKVEWKILSPSVIRVTINDKEAILNKDSQTFSAGPIVIDDDTLDIIYKAYDGGGNTLERWILSIYSQEKKQGTDRLVPTTFPISDKVFRIVSPSENPFKTTLNSVTVNWVIPKNTVEYIMVNNFRLKKYVPNSSSWYYYANISYGTMKEGFNLYEIKFYWTNDTLLSTQLFTIIKEWGTQTLSWE